MSPPNFSRNFPFWLMAVALCAAFGYFFVRGVGRSRPAEKKFQLPSPETIRKSGQQRLQKFKLTGFDEGGKTFWNLEGDAAQIDPKQTVFLEENVTLRLQDRTTIRTDRVKWSQKEGTLQTDATVIVEHQEAHVIGTGAWGRPNEGFIQLQRDIVMDLKSGSRVQCKGPLKIYYHQDRMVFYREVVVTDERGRLSANRMDVLFDPDERKVREIIAEGNAVIERGGDRTRSRRAIYSMKTGSVRLEGNPEVTLTQTESGITGPADNGLTGNQIAS